MLDTLAGTFLGAANQAHGHNLLNRQTRDVILTFARAYPRRTALMVLLLVFAGLSEMVGIAALLPVLSAGIENPMAGPQEGQGGSNAVSDAILRLLDFLGMDRSLASLLTLVVIAIFLKACFRWFAMRQVGYSVAKVARDLRERLLRALMNVRWSYFTSQPTGFFANAISTESQRAASSYRRACSALAGLIQIPVYVGLIVAISWQIALASLFLGAAAAAVLSSFVGMSRRAGGDQTQRMKSLLAQLTDALQAVKPIKAMGREDKFEDLVSGDIGALEQAERKHVLAAESLRSFQEPILMLIIAVGLLATVRWGGISFTEILMIAFLFHRLAGRFYFVQLEYEMLVVGESAYWSLEELTAGAEAMAEPVSGRRKAPPLRDAIRLVSVSFSYPSREVLSDVSMEIPAGSFVATVGPSGGGKTTVLDLIAGLHEPDSGTVEVDEIPLSELDRAAWRGQLGYVPQETVLFHDTVLRNIWLSREGVDEQRVRVALDQADALGFVESLPDGLHTVIGERGSKLSGGQRQRLAIARALVGRPRLLMLDEATTALDPATEAAILRTLRKLRGEVTILAISHQDALRGVADRIYELDHGRMTRIDASGATAESLGVARR